MTIVPVSYMVKSADIKDMVEVVLGPVLLDKMGHKDGGHIVPEGKTETKAVDILKALRSNAFTYSGVDYVYRGVDYVCSVVYVKVVERDTVVSDNVEVIYVGVFRGLEGVDVEVQGILFHDRPTNGTTVDTVTDESIVVGNYRSNAGKNIGGQVSGENGHSVQVNG